MGAKIDTAGGTRDVWGTGTKEISQMEMLLVEQRKSLLDSLKGDLPTYLNYKFEAVATEIQLDQIRTALEEFADTPIPTDVIEAAVKDGHYGYNWFYKEIIERIRIILSGAQVGLGFNSRRDKDGIDVTDLNVHPD